MDTYTAVTDPDILAKVKSNISASTKDISKASEVTDPALFLKIQEQLKKDFYSL